MSLRLVSHFIAPRFLPPKFSSFSFARLASMITSRAAVAEEWNKPVLKQVVPKEPAPDGSTVRIRVVASCVSAFVRFRCASDTALSC